MVGQGISQKVRAVSISLQKGTFTSVFSKNSSKIVVSKKKNIFPIILRWTASDNQIPIWFKIGPVGTKHFIGNCEILVEVYNPEQNIQTALPNFQ